MDVAIHRHRHQVVKDVQEVAEFRMVTLVGDDYQTDHNPEPPYPDGNLRPVAQLLRVDAAEPPAECGDGKGGLVQQFGTSSRGGWRS